MKLAQVRYFVKKSSSEIKGRGWSFVEPPGLEESGLRHGRSEYVGSLIERKGDNVKWVEVRCRKEGREARIWRWD